MARLLPDLRRHVEAAWPREACGLIAWGEGGYTVRPGRNLRPAAEAHAAFELDPATLVASLRAGEEVAALYHSHCDAPPIPSAADHRAAVIEGRPAWPGVELWIISVDGGALAVVARYRIDERGELVLVARYEDR